MIVQWVQTWRVVTSSIYSDMEAYPALAIYYIAYRYLFMQVKSCKWSDKNARIGSAKYRNILAAIIFGSVNRNFSTQGFEIAVFCFVVYSLYIIVKTTHLCEANGQQD